MNLFTAEINGQPVLRAMPLLLVVLCVLAIAYRFYSAFLAAKVAMLDDLRKTPAHEFEDGQNYHPTNKWVLFGHHFAAISGAGPLIGPILAIQYGYLPGLLWIVIGVCLAGAVQDMLVLAASVRRGGKSLAQIALTELGKPASLVVSLAILFIVVIALAGLGFVVVKALGGEEVKLLSGTEILVPKESRTIEKKDADTDSIIWEFPEGCRIRHSDADEWFVRPERFTVKQTALEKKEERTWQADLPEAEIIRLNRECTQFFEGDKGKGDKLPIGTEIHATKDQYRKSMAESDRRMVLPLQPGSKIRFSKKQGWTTQLDKSKVISSGEIDEAATITKIPAGKLMHLGSGCTQLITGSSWGTFTIACTIPIALFVSFWMYRFRKGRVVEASALGAIAVLVATVAGGSIPGSSMEPYFSLTKTHTILALCAYGFIASVLPVWMLLCPRDYVSSFLKIGTIALLVIGVLVANPPLPCPQVNEVFAEGGPTFSGSIFPFVFICIMCGSISGFHALVASGTTPKMIDKESDVRMIGYGSMLIEGLVGVIALIAAASLPVDLYYDVNVSLELPPAQAKKTQEDLATLYKNLNIDRDAARAQIGVQDLAHLDVQDANLAEMEQLVGGESLRGRTGGAVTLAVGMARILTQASAYFVDPSRTAFLVKYWYHFAIMFEALFILTTIDTGTRIARFLMQETLGQVWPSFGRTDWLPGSILATAAVTAGWGTLVYSGSIGTIWPMFGIANQLLAVLALCLVTTLLINAGRARHAWVTLLPMLFVTSTTMSAGIIMIARFNGFIADGSELIRQGAKSAGVALQFKGIFNISLTVFVMASVGFILLWAGSRWIGVLGGAIPVRKEPAVRDGLS